MNLYRMTILHVGEILEFNRNYCVCVYKCRQTNLNITIPVSNWSSFVWAANLLKITELVWANKLYYSWTESPWLKKRIYNQVLPDAYCGPIVRYFRRSLLPKCPLYEWVDRICSLLLLLSSISNWAHTWAYLWTKYHCPCTGFDPIK